MANNQEENNKIIIYNTGDGGMKIEVKLVSSTPFLDSLSHCDLLVN